MKTMMSVDGKKIVRISDEKASKLYSEGWQFIAKSVWKEKVRYVEKPTEEKSTNNKFNKLSKSQKRHMRKSNK